MAAVKGQVGAARALVTDQAETHLRNAEDELREEQVEIALYSRIEAFATQVGDRDTAQPLGRSGARTSGWPSTSRPSSDGWSRT